MIYTKNNVSVLVYPRFVYSVELYAYNKGYFSLMKKEYYSAPKYIENYIGSYWKDKYFQITAELYAAPLNWLIENGYSEEVKKEKPKRKKKNEQNENQTIS